MSAPRARQIKLTQNLSEWRKRLGWRFYLIILVALFIDVFGITHLVTNDPGFALRVAAILTPGLIVLFFPVNYVTVLVHELGHAAAAKLLGVRLYGFRIANVEYSHLSSGTRWRKVEARSILGGAVYVAPHTMERLLFRRNVLVLAGPASSLLLGALCLWLWSRISNGQDMWDVQYLFNGHFLDPLLRHLPVYFGWYSLIMGVQALLPITYRKQSFDGMQIYLSIFKRAYMMEAVAASMAYIPWLYGRRARDWDPEPIEFLLTNATTPQFQVLGRMFAYYRQIDLGNLEEANRHVLSAVRIAEEDPNSEKVKGTYDGVFQEAAYAAAYYRHDLDEANRLLAKCDPPKVDKYSINYRATAAIRMMEGKIDEAKFAMQEGIKRFEAEQKGPIEDSMKLEYELLTQPVDKPLIQSITI